MLSEGDCRLSDVHNPPMTTFSRTDPFDEPLRLKFLQIVFNGLFREISCFGHRSFTNGWILFDQGVNLFLICRQVFYPLYCPLFYPPTPLLLADSFEDTASAAS